MYPLVNLYPWREQRFKQRKKSIWIIGGLVLLISLTIHMIHWQKFHEQQRVIESELATLHQLRLQLDDQQKIASSEQQRFELEKAQFVTLRERIERNNQPILLMNILPPVLPTDVVLDDLSWQPPWVNLSGRVSDAQSLQVMVEELSAVIQFHDVEIGSLTSSHDGQSSFTVKFRLTTLSQQEQP
ncbi:PilN domain-containing protein [Vibrio porteresiae]|uniref:PilN domain-containing protein n=1 Tax=Vibrio porteresiae DSM 19223 TaxID=1123496 RepID=A0ABZ0QBQ2_9VIBR|nr:PilN domain-containing protein [Vibrio porteresiae]WPC73873.1 PilN domain-containing protein [Vibrio porteresiae DSM 19223]